MKIIKLNTIYKPKIILNKKIFNCQIGQKGVRPSYKKIEGDFSTPRGKWKIGKILLRKEKFSFLKIKKSFRSDLLHIHRNSLWCDDARSMRYNKYIKKNKESNLNFSYENLYRHDDVYDIVIEIKYNVKPTIKAKGSAIFIHCSFDDYRSTKGCVAISKKNLTFLLSKLKNNYQIKIC